MGVLSLYRGWAIAIFVFSGGGDLFLMGLRGRFIENFPNVAGGWGLSNIAREKTLYHHNPCRYNYETFPKSHVVTCVSLKV